MYRTEWEELRSAVIFKIMNSNCHNQDIIRLSIQVAYNIFKNEIKRKDYGVNKSTTFDNLDLKESKLLAKISEDKSNLKRMYNAHVFEIVWQCKGNILEAQRKIKLPYFEVRKAFVEYKQYLEDYFKEL